MKVIIQLTKREEAKALPILLRHSPGMILPNRQYVLSEEAVIALRRGWRVLRGEEILIVEWKVRVYECGETSHADKCGTDNGVGHLESLAAANCHGAFYLGSPLLQLEFKLEDTERMQDLAAKARDGSLTKAEEEAIRNYEHVGNLLALMKSKARQRLNREAASGDATPSE